MRCRFLPVLLALTLFLAATSARARNALYAVSSRGMTAVAVGDSGRILQSPEAAHKVWFATTRSFPFAIRAVTTGADDYVAVGDGGKLMRSADGNGLLWQARSSRAGGKDLLGVAHTGDRLVAVGDSGVIVRSVNQSMDSWTPVEGVPTKKRLRAVAGETRLMVAVGDSGTILWCPVGGAVWMPASTVETHADL